MCDKNDAIKFINKFLRQIREKKTSNFFKSYKVLQRRREEERKVCSWKRKKTGLLPLYVSFSFLFDVCVLTSHR